MIIEEVPRDALVDKVNVKKYRNKNKNHEEKEDIIVFKKRECKTQIEDVLNSYDVVFNGETIGAFDKVTVKDKQFGCCINNELYIIEINLENIKIYKDGNKQSVITLTQLNGKYGNAFKCENNIAYIIIGVFINEMLFTYYKVPDHLPRFVKIGGWNGVYRDVPGNK